LGKMLPDGNMEFLGRKDDQVKIRGYRIEPGEIENMLLQSNSINECVVVAKDDGTGNKQLVAYVVPLKDFDKQKTLAYLQGKLPAYMVPALLMPLEKIPLTANGKINKKALPDVNFQRFCDLYMPPTSKTEMALAEIWKRILSAERIGIHDHFFDLGGHSLMVYKIIAAIRDEFSVNLPLRIVFELPTIADLGKYIDVMTSQLQKDEMTMGFETINM